MQFRLLHTEVPNLKLEKINIADNQSYLHKDVFNLGLHVFPDNHRKDVFAVLFKLELSHHQEFNLHIDYLAWFESAESINDEFLGSPFAQANAPAIAFPYLRSFVSLLTLNSGFLPAILPTVNFLKMFDAKNEAP